MDPIRPQDHLKLSVAQEQCRETMPDITACTDEKKALAVSESEQEDSSKKETTNSAEEQLNSLQNRANRVVQKARFERSREKAWRQSVEQRRAEHGEKKQKLRRRRLVLDAEKIQDQEPMHVSPFNALPHFEYLEIAQAVETDLPPALIRFGSLGLSTTEATSDKYTNQPYVPQGNLPCIFMTCPISEMHCEGPYHHNSKYFSECLLLLSECFYEVWGLSKQHQILFFPWILSRNADPDI